jgi:DNA polymerase III epsilon subunit-like protein
MCRIPDSGSATLVAPAWHMLGSMDSWTGFPGSYAVVDVETTGLSPARDRIVEIAVVRVWAGAILQRWSSLVNPGVPISPFATACHGLTDADVAHAPTLSSLLPTIRRLVAGTTIAAHNAAFDRGFLPMLSQPWTCTLELSRRTFPGFPNHRLGTVIDLLGLRRHLEGQSLHRAGTDAEAAALLLMTCLTQVPQAA